MRIIEATVVKQEYLPTTNKVSFTLRAWHKVAKSFSFSKADTQTVISRYLDTYSHLIGTYYFESVIG